MTRSERVEHSYSIRSRRWFSTSGVSRFEDPKLELRRFNPTMFLLVCRQVNAEAALIPFQINEFTYGNSDSFHRFVDKLSANQRSSIKLLRMDCKAFQMAFEALNEFRLTGKHPAYDVVHPLTKLTGLRYVRGEQDGFVENEEDRDLAAVRGEEMAMRGLKQFGAPDGVKFQFKDRGRYICLTVPDA